MEQPPSAGKRLRSAASRRTGWTVSSQALSSISNFLIAIVVARVASTEEFGAFGIAMATYFFFAGALRAILGETLIVRFSAASADVRFAAATSAVNAALGIGTLSAILLAAALLPWFDGTVVACMLALAVCLPGLALQDAWRYGFFVLGRPRSAAANDGIWILFQVIAVGALLLHGEPGAPSLLLAWGLAGSCAGACGFLQARPARPSLRRSWTWPLEHADLGGRFFSEFLATIGTGQLCLYGLGLLSGLTAVASVRGAVTLLGPVGILYWGVTITAIMEGGRLGDDGRKLRHLLQSTSTALVVGTALWLAILLVLPFRTGTSVLGESWSGARGVLAFTGAWYVFNGLAAGAIVGLRIRQDAARSLRARLQLVPLTLALPIAGAQLWDAEGFALGLALASLAGAALWWYQYVCSAQSGSPPEGRG